MTFEEIQSELNKRNILLADIADALLVTRSHVSTVVKLKAKSLRVANAIALCLEKNTDQVFGDTYTGENIGRGEHRKTRKQQVIDALRNNECVPQCTSIA